MKIVSLDAVFVAREYIYIYKKLPASTTVETIDRQKIDT